MALDLSEVAHQMIMFQCGWLVCPKCGSRAFYDGDAKSLLIQDMNAEAMACVPCGLWRVVE